MKVSMLGKNGDLVYSLPVIKALAREHGPVTLVTSALCFQIVPILWDLPYIADVEMLEREVHIEDGSLVPWAVLGPGEGINLSPQPSMYRPNAPIPWTYAYAEIAGVKKLLPNDRIALPTLWNHRQWYWEHRVETQERGVWQPPRTCVLAPESQTLRTIPIWVWAKVATRLSKHFTVILVGEKPDGLFPVARDLRGLTTVSSMARLLAEASLVICANSLPWHLARHAGTPTFCFQDAHVERCVPVDTPYVFYTSDKWEPMCEAAEHLAMNPRTTLWNDRDLRELSAA